VRFKKSKEKHIVVNTNASSSLLDRLRTWNRGCNGSRIFFQLVMCDRADACEYFRELGLGFGYGFGSSIDRSTNGIVCT